MPPSPGPLLRQRSPITLVLEKDPLEYGNEDPFAPDEEALQETSHLAPSIHDTLDTKAGGVQPSVPEQVNTRDMFLLVGIFAMLVWPWIFLTIVWVRGGVQISNHVAKAVIDHPQSTSFFATLLGNIVSAIVSILFSMSIIRLAQEWVTDNDHVSVFDVSLISAFRHQNWPWGIKDLKYMVVQNRWLPVLLVGCCLAAFAFVPSGTTSLITPVPFHRLVPLTGTELDFSSSATDCIDWFAKNKMPNNCDWGEFNGLRYVNCLGDNQMVDILLESGRANIRSLLSNKSESLALSQLGERSGLHFVGPMRGVLPTGPNGLPGFDTLQSSPFSFNQTKAAMLSYNYTLDHQGLYSNVSCIYDTQGPIVFTVAPGNTDMIAYIGTCDGLDDVLADVGGFLTTLTNGTLTFWACKSPPTGMQAPSYFIYLRGRGIYGSIIGNVTCTVSPIQPAIFPVIYQSSTGFFSSKERILTSPTLKSFSESIESALIGLNGVVELAQSVQANLLVEAVIYLGVQSFGLSPYEQNEQYLRLYEAMIQGILVDELTYIRFIYSTATPGPPSSCFRTVHGTLSAEVIGWFAKPVHIGFLLPMTIINLASLGIILAVIFRVKKVCHDRDFDPTDPRPLVLAEPSLDEGDPSGWTDGVTYRPREWLQDKVFE